MERLQEREKELEMVERLDTEIRAYRDQGKVGQKKLAKMKQPAAMPGHLGLQAAHFRRDDSALPHPSWPALCYMSSREGPKKQ